jgi:acyl-CoA thioesterase I
MGVMYAINGRPSAQKMNQTKLDFKRRALVLAATGLLATVSSLQAKARSSTILVMGDSLSAEYGLPRGTGWVNLLQAKLKDHGLAGEVINASISGETTSGGRTRLGSLLQQHKPTHVVIELGANDALRGLSLKSSRENLLDMIQASQQAGAQVVLVGMMVPPNYGKRYTEDFATMFGQLAKERHTALVPFLLKGIADRPDARDWFQADGIHPLPKGHPIMLDQVWTALAPLL